MNIFKYHERAKHRQDYCEVCRMYKAYRGGLQAHHIYRRKHGDECIWVCDLCHRMIENPSAFGLSSSWAYDKGYLIKFTSNSMATKKKVIKKCTHKACMYNYNRGGMVCQFCGQVVKTDTFKKPSNKKKAITKSSTKMGFEPKNEGTIKVEQLKAKKRKLDMLVRKSIGVERVEFVKQRDVLLKEMRGVSVKLGV